MKKRVLESKKKKRERGPVLKYDKVGKSTGQGHIRAKKIVQREEKRATVLYDGAGKGGKKEHRSIRKESKRKEEGQKKNS